MRRMLVVTLLLFLALAVFADKKNREWLTGKVLDTDSAGFTTYGGTNTQGRVNADGTYTSSSTRTSWNHKKEAVAIEGEEYIYIVSHVLSWRWSKEISLTVNDKVKYVVEKNKLILLDDNGREFKMRIEKKILKEPKP